MKPKYETSQKNDTKQEAGVFSPESWFAAFSQDVEMFPLFCAVKDFWTYDAYFVKKFMLFHKI